MKRPILIFGLIAGGIVSVFMATSMAIGSCMHDDSFYDIGMVIGYASMLIAFSFIFIGVKSYRDKHLGGSITFGKAFFSGLVIAFVASTMYVVTWAIEYNLFMPDFMDKYAAHMIEGAVASGKTAAEIQQMTGEMNDMKEMYSNPVLFTLFTYVEILPVGLLITLISAVILRKKPAGEVVV